MKRIQAACICQTLHFMLKDGVRRDYAAALVRQEVEQYKKGWNATTPSTRSSRKRNSPTARSSSRSSNSITPARWATTWTENLHGSAVRPCGFPPYPL